MDTPGATHVARRPAGESPSDSAMPGLDVIHAARTPPYSMRLDHVPTDRIVPNPYQPRRIFDRDKMRDLKGTIRAVGALQPITLWQRDDDCFVVIAGERRLLAYRELEAELPEREGTLYHSIPALIRDLRDVDQDVQFAMLASIENLARDQLKPGERARAMQQLRSMGLTWQEIADRMGLSLVKVQDYAGIGLVEQLALAVDEGRVTQVRGVAIARALKPVVRTDEQLASALVPHLIAMQPSRIGEVVRAALELPSTSTPAERAQVASTGMEQRPADPTGPVSYEEVSRRGERTRLTYVVPARTNLAMLLRRRRVPIAEWVRALQEHCEEIGVWPARPDDTPLG
jgi:ParB/RepB/Spo0J family partition protein